MMWFETLAPAFSYFLYNWQFFRGAETVLPVTPLRMRWVTGIFFVNYGIFFLCSIANLHLIVNWIIFLVLLSIEQMIIYRRPAKECFLLALFGTQFGLAANILFRSLIAVILNMPLYVFDSRVSYTGNMKSFPVLLGFLAGGMFFWGVRRLGWLQKLSLTMNHRSTLLFLLSLLTVMYGYLCMNLVVYYIGENSLVLKLWSMKSSIFVMVGEWLAIVLGIRMGQLADYRAKSQESREAMAKEMARELELRIIAGTDPLTGCENRLQANKRLINALERERDFCVCFADLNGLKQVNDRFGHEMGDKYLIAVSETLQEACGPKDYLFRYGGDEFLILFFDITAAMAEEKLIQAQQRLDERKDVLGYLFPMNFSYGIASSQEASEEEKEPEILIRAADARMYKMKMTLRDSLSSRRHAPITKL